MNKALKIIIPLAVYLAYGYLFVWQIDHLNSGIVHTELQEGDKIFFRYTGSIVIVLYGVLLYVNVINDQKNVIVLNSFFAASLLFMHPGIFSTIVSILLMLFGLIVAFFELKKINDDK